MRGTSFLFEILIAEFLSFNKSLFDSFEEGTNAWRNAKFPITHDVFVDEKLSINSPVSLAYEEKTMTEELVISLRGTNKKQEDYQTGTLLKLFKPF